MRILQYFTGMGCVAMILFCPVTSQSQEDAVRMKSIEASLPLIDQLFKDYAVKNKFPGVVYGLVVDGKLVFTGNAGYANLSKKIPADQYTDFHIASMTKSFTAMAILKLRDEGKLNLDDPAYLYIPELKSLKYPSSDGPAITIRNLLSHAAGFPEDNPWGDRQLAVTEQEFIEFLNKGISFSNDAAIAYEYSNLGFGMLGYIIHKVSGKTYDEYITQNILVPLGMTHTYWEYSKVPDVKLAMGYRWLNEGWVEQPLLHNGLYGAMGGMITTIEDFSKYINFQLSAWPPGDAPETGPVKRSTVREMQHPWNIPSLATGYKYPSGRSCPLVSAYAFGLGWTKDCEGRILVGHSGGLPGFGSQWRILPDYGIGIVAFANHTYANMSMINMAALDTLIALAKLKPRAVAVSPVLKQRQKELLALLPEWKGAKESGIFSVNFFLDYFTDSLKKEAGAIYARAGKIIRVNEMIAENNLRGYCIIEAENENIGVHFTLSPENPALIQEYDIYEIKKSP